MSQPENIRDKWLRQLAALRDEIAALPEGQSREAAVRRAQQLENATQMELWMQPVSEHKQQRK